MTVGITESPCRGPLELEGLAQWLVERGLKGLPLGEQIAGFCQRVHEAGLPIRRCLVGMGTLHPRYGAHTFVWRPEVAGIEHVPRERSIENRRSYRESPIFHMRSRGLLALRQRLDVDGAEAFSIYAELRAEGLLDYAAQLVPYDPARAEAIAKAFAEGGEAPDRPPVPGHGLDGLFFSCATDRPEGFDDAALGQVVGYLPYLALAVKSRLTYDVASTVIETYLGRDAGKRVLTGAIERGSVEAIRAVIWFSDLRGFTRLADVMPRETLVEMLDDYLEAMARPVREKRGQILKFMGDGLLATFDLTDRDAAGACHDALEAARALRRVFPRFNRARAAAGKPVMDFGLALHLGDVLYGNIGASDRLDFTVVGPAVNEASRIQALCRPLDRDVLLSSALREAASDEAGRLMSLGFHALRGVREPQELFALDG